MRNLILFIVLFIVLVGCQGMTSQNIAPNNKYFKVLDVKNTNKNVIFDKTLKYITSNFKSTKSIVDYQNKEDGSLSFNMIVLSYWNHPTAGKVPMDIEIKIVISIKDNKLKAEIVDTTIINNACLEYEGVKCPPEKTFYTQAQSDMFYGDMGRILDELVDYILKDTTDNW